MFAWPGARLVPQDNDGGADDGVGHEGSDAHELDQFLDVEDEGDECRQEPAQDQGDHGDLMAAGDSEKKWQLKGKEEEDVKVMGILQIMILF